VARQKKTWLTKWGPSHFIEKLVNKMGPSHFIKKEQKIWHCEDLDAEGAE
jgi:hypothetical protein